jgi:hypothetical protein
MGDGETVSTIPSLLDDSAQLSAEHVRDVAHARRFLERWNMDSSYRDMDVSDPEAAPAALGVALFPSDTDPLIDVDLAARVINESAMALLDALFRQGVLDEEPAVVLESATPQALWGRRPVNVQLTRDGG